MRTMTFCSSPHGGNPGAGAGGDAKLATLDPTIADLQSTARPEKLLRNDGTIVHANRQERRGGRTGHGPDQSATSTQARRSSTAEVIPERQCHASHERERWYRFLFEQQLTTCAVQSISVPMMIAGDGRIPGSFATTKSSSTNRRARIRTTSFWKAPYTVSRRARRAKRRAVNIRTV
jgi:hypothetical protein